MKKLIIIIIPLLLIVSCVYNTVADASYSTNFGFTAELDEPSSRGQLKRVSPNESFVGYRFCISPDKKNIVYSGYQAGGGDKLYQLWKIPITGGASTKITSGGSNYCISPSFTSDGKYLVYESAGKLWKVRQDGAGGKTLIPGSGTGYDITPQLSSQNKLVFCSVSQVQTYQNLLKYFIWTSNLNGGELTQIREGKNPLWSPDGKQIIFDHAGEIWLINADGTELQQLTNSSEVIESIPSFSDNGEYIVFVSNETKTGNLSLRGSNWNIWSMKTDGSEKQQITELSSWDSWPLYSGNSIYFLSGRATKKKQNTQRIWKLQLHNE